MAVLSLNKVSRRFGGVFAVQDFSMIARPGRITGLIGPNGAGKSTLIDVLSGGAAHWSGTVKMFGRDIGAMSALQRRRAGLARSFQRTNIFPDLTVIDQLEIAARAAETPNIDEIMSELTLTALAHKRAADTSYGDQRRLDLALALIGRPKILLLDEPAAGLSIKESLDLAHNLRDLAARWGVTVLLVEHDMEVVFSICDRITVLHLGGTLAEGTPNEIREIPEVITAYLGSTV
jgi:branched-chain amino acid transport system ATP-binding protein